jgi:hypothetical protein
VILKRLPSFMKEVVKVKKRKKNLRRKKKKKKKNLVKNLRV